MFRESTAVVSALTLGFASPAFAFDVFPTSDPVLLGANVLGPHALPDQEVLPTGSSGSVGTFVDGPFGMEHGIVLSTGRVVDALPPDDAPRAGHAFGTSGASTFCDHLPGAGSYFDAAHVRLHFTSTVTIETVRFRVALATEELGEPATPVGDAAAFFLDGALVRVLDIGGLGSSAFVGGTGMQFDGVAEAYVDGDGSSSVTVDFVICDGTDALGDSALFVGPLEICSDAVCSPVVACALSDVDGDQTNSCADCDDLDAFRSPNQTELCNAIDDDCDGAIDEGTAAGGACEVGVGACARTGTVVCSSGGELQCDAVAGAPSPEICGDLQDSNCDGDPEDGCSGSGGSGAGDAGGSNGAGGEATAASGAGAYGPGGSGGSRASGGSAGTGDAVGGAPPATTGGAGAALGGGASPEEGKDGPKYPGCNCEQPGLTSVESTSAAAALVMLLAYVRRRRGQAGRGSSHR
jgi:hypothetical protein